METIKRVEEGCSLPSSSNELEVLVRQLKREVKALATNHEKDFLNHDGKIAEMCKYIKDNLSNSLRELLDSMITSGEIDKLISEAVVNEIALLNLEFTNLKDGIKTKVDVTYFGVIGDDKTDNTKKLQYLLDNYKEIYIPDGTYKLTNTLYVSEGCKLHLSDNAIMKSYHNKPFIINGKPSDKDTSLYNGNSNILIEGGIWDNNPSYSQDLKGTFVFGHAKNITIRDLTILNNIKTHTIELAGVDDCVIENIKFKGYVPHPTVNYVEAIQIEMCTNGFAYFGKQDYTISKNIIVKNCLFDKSDKYGYFQTACGNHATIHNHFIENITFENNIVLGCTYAGFRAYCFKNTKVIGNLFDSCNRGVMFAGSNGNDNFSKDISGVQTNIPEACKNIIVENNTFINGETVDIWSNNYSTNKATALVKDVHIKNNKMSGCKAINIYIVKGENIDISNNIIENSSDSFMELKDIVGMQLSNNIMKNTQDYGLMLQDSTPTTPITKGIVITNNVFESLSNHCINIRGVHNVVINSNNIKECKLNPININNMCENMNISNNVITSSSSNSNGYIRIVGALNKEIDISTNTKVNYGDIQYVDVSDKSTIRLH